MAAKLGSLPGTKERSRLGMLALSQAKSKDHTWKDKPVLSSPQLDELIHDCDFDVECVGDEKLCLPFSAFRVSPDSSWRDRSILGYGVAVDAQDAPTSTLDDESSPQSYIGSIGDLSREASTQDSECSDSNSQFQTVESALSTESFQLCIPSSIRAENRLSQSDAGLFNVYLTAVAPTLVPVHEARNPWLRYPAIALHLSFQEGKNHLLHALMAHAAFSLGHQGFNQTAMSALGTKLYSSAMAELRACLQDAPTDYVGLLTTILTFLLIELSRGSSKAWRLHLQAAWRFLQEHQNSKSWTTSPDAWYVTQSFHLLKTGSDACGFIPNDANDSSTTTSTATNSAGGILAQEVTCNPGYGWTLGTSSSVMETIASINAIAAHLQENDMDDSTVNIPLRFTRTLLRYQREVLEPEAIDSDRLKREPRYLHLQAFQAATVIYYYQTCGELSPRELSRLVSAVLSFLSAFFEICGGSFTLWPFIVAAAEAYEEDDQLKFMTLLENLGTVGMRNISSYKTLLKQIWNARAVRAIIEDREIADTRVDWREVMRELEMDVLIL